MSENRSLDCFELCITEVISVTVTQLYNDVPITNKGMKQQNLAQSRTLF